MNGLLGKIFGWAQFGLQVLGSVSQGGAPHGWAGWVQLIGSLAAAIGIHAASNVGQVVAAPTPATRLIAGSNGGSHVKQ